MCMIGDDFATMLTEAQRLARKDHYCGECRRVIGKGERYTYETALFDGYVSTYKTCPHCVVARGWLLKQCGGWCWEMIKEDIGEHVRDKYKGLARVYVGMRRKWKTVRGGLMPVPAMPEIAGPKPPAASCGSA